jgi:pimeloyl-ACP methyl ester carboxylesterase
LSAELGQHTITGGGGVRLHAIEAGNPAGQALVFVHGWSQCLLAWTPQLRSALASEFRLVALDSRGHGLSEKPRDGYADSRLWAEDLNAVITELGLEQPIVSGWSYGGLVICDYLRVYGQSGLGGVHLVGATTKLGTDAAANLVGKEFLKAATDSCTDDAEAYIAAIKDCLRLVGAEQMPTELFYLVLGYNAVVPPHVRKALFSRVVENDDVLADLRLPVLITHGDCDPVVLPQAGEQHHALIPHSRHSVYPGVGHTPFAEDTARFNRELREFADSI